MIRPIQEKDCLKIAEIHKESLDGDFLPALGLNVLKTIYKGFLKDKKNFGYVAEKEGDVIGFVTGSEDADVMFKKIVKEEFMPLTYYIARALIKKPFLVFNTIQTFKYNKKSKTDTKSELLSFAVKKEYRCKGLGRELFKILIKDFKIRGFNKIKVTVNKSNTAANKFYQTMGFKLAGEFNIYNKKMNVYTLEID